MWRGRKKVEIEKSDKRNWKNKISSPCFHRSFSPQHNCLRSCFCWKGRVSAFTFTFWPQDDLLCAQSRRGPSPSYSHRTNSHSDLAITWDTGISLAMCSGANWKLPSSCTQDGMKTEKTRIVKSKAEEPMYFLKAV